MITGSIAGISDPCPIVMAGSMPTDGLVANANVIGAELVVHTSTGLWTFTPSEPLPAGKTIVSAQTIEEFAAFGATVDVDISAGFLLLTTRDLAGNVADLAFTFTVRVMRI